MFLIENFHNTARLIAKSGKSGGTVALLLAEERRQRLAEIVSHRGFVSLTELVEATGASESTVRRDLEFLHDSGILRRTHGGAAATGNDRSNAPLPAFEDRRQNQSNEKQAI